MFYVLLNLCQNGFFFTSFQVIIYYRSQIWKFLYILKLANTLFFLIFHYRNKKCNNISLNCNLENNNVTCSLWEWQEVLLNLKLESAIDAAVYKLAHISFHTLVLLMENYAFDLMLCSVNTLNNSRIFVLCEI